MRFSGVCGLLPHRDHFHPSASAHAQLSLPSCQGPALYPMPSLDALGELVEYKLPTQKAGCSIPRRIKPMIYQINNCRLPYPNNALRVRIMRVSGISAHGGRGLIFQCGSISQVGASSDMTFDAAKTLNKHRSKHISCALSVQSASLSHYWVSLLFSLKFHLI